MNQQKAQRRLIHSSEQRSLQLEKIQRVLGREKKAKIYTAANRSDCGAPAVEAFPAVVRPDAADESVMTISKERNLYKIVDGKKTANGAFYTKKPFWLTAPVRRFIEIYLQRTRRVLDPFAGAGDMLSCMKSEYGAETDGYDIAGGCWTFNDSLKSVPNPHGAVICTNPPHLAKHSAKRKGVWSRVGGYYNNLHYDLYETAIDRCLESARAGVFIIPETFLHSKFPKHRLRLVSVIIDNPFTDTENPVCVACFDSECADGEKNADVYVGDNYLFPMSVIDRKKYRSEKRGVSFNRPDGNIALKAIDGVFPGDRIRFERPEKFYYGQDKIKESSRLLTYLRIDGISGDEADKFILSANAIVERLRENTHDLLLSPFKGNNKAGERRRRLDYALARYVISEALRQGAAQPARREVFL